MTCKKAQGYLEKNVVAVKELHDASKNKQGAKEALALARSAARVVVARGKKIVAFDMKKDAPDDETLLAQILGPSGNLRAPTVRKGNTLLIGFSDDLYREWLR